MSKVHFSVVRCTGFKSTDGEFVPLEDMDSVGTPEVITATGTSQTTTLAVTNQFTGDPIGRYAWCVTNMGTAPVYVKSGSATPTASVTGKGVAAGTTRYFRCQAFTDKIAVILA